MSDAGEIARLLTESLERLGVSVERVRLDDYVSGGGLCNVRGRRVVYLDRANSVDRDREVLTDALSRIADENTFLPPLIRDWLDRHANIVQRSS